MDGKILIVDDEPAMRQLLSRFLGGAGYECCTAEDAVSAKESLSLHVFDLLLCDLKLPGESGLDLLRYTKKHYPHLGRVMITGSGSSEIASEIMTVGVYGYIIKPAAQNVVLITVENALRHLRLDLHLHACKVELEKNAALRTEKLTAIMNNLNVGVVMFDLNMKILEINKQMRHWFPDLCLGTSLPYCTLIQPSRGDVCYCPSPDETSQTANPFEKTINLATAKGEREFRIVTSPIIDKSGSVYARISLYEDVTEKMLLERDLTQAQKFEAVGQLAAGIAHEINTPIQYIGDNISFLKDSFEGISGVLDTYNHLWQKLKERDSVPMEMDRQLTEEIGNADIAFLWEEIPKTIIQTLEGVQRVEKIVRAMKEFSHPGSDEKTAVDINKILESAITVCRNEWKYVAEMETNFAPNLPLTPCLASEISQVFLNILVNGAHAIAESTHGDNKGKGTMIVRTIRMDNSVQIRISDTGGGIPKEIQGRVFDQFFTTKAKGKGTGQGLAIARRVIVDKHKGALSFETAIGQGTTFVIDLPNQ